MFFKRVTNRMEYFLDDFLSPTRIIIFSFLAVIFIGTILLWLPFSNNYYTSFIDALFTATSAVCVTGLSPVVTAEHWTIIGKIVIIVLIQIGGLGTMTIFTLVMFIFNKKISFKERIVLQEATGQSGLGGVIRLIKSIINTSLFVEFLGAILLSIKFVPEYGIIKGICYALFHSISAFCNAGFDLIGNSSLSPYVDNLLVNITLMILIVLSSLGFTVWFDLLKNKQENFNLFKWFVDLKNSLIKSIKKILSLRLKDILYVFKKLPENLEILYFKICKYMFNLSLQTKLVLISTFILIFGGAFIIFVSEFNNPDTLGNLSIGGKIYASFFQSVSARTAGFVTIDLSKMNYSSKLCYIILMFIGGSPGGTAGGMKTITIVVIFLAVISIIKGNDKIVSFNRKIPFLSLQKALTIVMMGISLLIISCMILTFTEDTVNFEFMDILFEVSSAISTTGSSLAFTSSLSVIGKVVICILMYIGRLGPMTVVMSLTGKNKETNNNIDYPSEDNIMIG